MGSLSFVSDTLTSFPVCAVSDLDGTAPIVSIVMPGCATANHEAEVHYHWQPP